MFAVPTSTPFRAPFRAEAPRDPRLPHPSWRRSLEPSPTDGAATIRNAGDFWSRLGL